jgi:thiol:disulfide interchange protein
MNRSLLLLVVGMLLGNASGFTCEKLQEAATYVPVTKFDPNRDAGKDIQNAVVEAGRTGKRILLDVGGDWCIWCRRLDSLFAANKDLAELLHQGFVVVKVNWSRENKNEGVLSHYPKIPGYPHLFVLDSKGKLLQSQDTGQLESGNHHDREKVLAFLKKWAP